MALRLLAFNAEAWLAEHLDAYLADPDECRSITRHLLHQGGHVTYTDTDITITLDRPNTPRIAGALALLLDLAVRVGKVGGSTLVSRRQPEDSEIGREGQTS